MPDYEKMYDTLRYAVVDSEPQLQDALIRLKAAQYMCDNIFIESDAGAGDEEQRKQESHNLPDYEKMYRKMFNAATDAVQSVNDAFDKLHPVKNTNNEVYLIMQNILGTLQTAQIECEEMHMRGDKQAEDEQ